jgi:predicted RNase H-like HicB family nuclease
MSEKLQIRLPTVVSIAFETNGKGYMGFIVELPGAFVRGRTEEEAIAKVNREVNLYLKWLTVEQKHDYTIKVVQMHRSSLMVEDADNEILSDADKKMLDEEEFQSLINLVWHSGETFFHLFANSKFKDWIDKARVRKTFYGETPKTIQETFNHVKGCQYYYLSRTKITFEEKEENFVKIREFCLAEIDKMYRKNNNSLIFNVDGELWTLKKILRRFIWHDRIHGKAITRILEKQRQLGVIDEFNDPFHFMETTP